ncbi:MAG: hypothetical protein M1330_02805 [Armatimonadetes bacterium]|nr:hypothetical protein [Armatimonadota bacterium]
MESLNPSQTQECFTPFVMLWAKSVPAGSFYGPQAQFSEASGGFRIDPEDTDAENSNENTHHIESSISYTW